MLQHDDSMPPSSISLMLNYGPLGLIRATRTLIDKNSIYVDTGPIALHDHSDVEIVLSIRSDQSTETHRIPATVSGHTEHGVKLQFKECAPATLNALLPFVSQI